MFGLLN